MLVEREQNIFGFAATVRVDVPQVVELSPSMSARLEHSVEAAMHWLSRRISTQVINWPKRQQVLLRLSLDDAEALGVEREWRKARKEGESNA